MEIYEKISELCSKRKMTIKDLENELDFSNGIIGKWKNNSPNIKYIIKIAEYFNISIDNFLDRIEDPDPEEAHLITNFRKCSDAGKKEIIRISEIEARKNILKPFA